MDKNTIVEGILINPELPDYMSYKDINERSEEHLKKWFGKPYINLTAYVAPDSSYEEYYERLKDYNSKLESEKEFYLRIERNKKSWFEHWGEDGIRYDVHILDGGSLDRPSNKGSYKTLDEALKVAKSLI